MLDKVHNFIIKFRVVANVLLLCMLYLMFDMWDFYQTNFKDLNTLAESSAFGAAWLAVIGVIKLSLEHILKKNEKDEE